MLELWGDSPQIDPYLYLPLKNEFIPEDFSLRNANILQNSMDTNYPKCIIDNPLIKLWHKIDLTFNVPRANAYFLITVKDGYCSLRTCVLTELFVSLLKDELNEIIYQVMYSIQLLVSSKPLSTSSKYTVREFLLFVWISAAEIFSTLFM